MKHGGILHKLWWHSTDRGHSALWRPYCWLRRHHVPHGCDVYFEVCVYCGRLLWSARRHGFPNPYHRHTGNGWVHDDTVPVGSSRRARLIVAAKRRRIAELEDILHHAGVDLREATAALHARQLAGMEATERR
jgi:hypothetical protein